MEHPVMRKTLKKMTNINIFQIIRYRLPIAGMVSILHRVSGFLLFIFLGGVLHWLDVSLSSQNGFHTVASYWQAPIVKIMMLVFVWFFFHHLCAGIRHLFLDIQWGLDKSVAQYTGAIVFVVSMLLAILCGVMLW